MSERLPLVHTGPPRALWYVLVFFVLVGGVVGVAWYATREPPRGEGDAGQRWKLHR